MQYVKNIWYAAAWSDEIPPGRLFSRVYLEIPVLIYRLNDGVPVALSDMCPHRFAPLHTGQLIDERVECPYHGLVFDRHGDCVTNPHGEGRIPRAATLQRFPLVERHNLLWIWMGDPNSADPDKIADFSVLADTVRWTTIYGYTNLKANSEIVIDNLTDLSHAPFIHEGLLETRDVCKGQFTVERSGDQVDTINWCPGIKPPPFFEMLKETAALKDSDGLVDHWQDMRYFPPGCMNTFYGITKRGAGRDTGLATENPNLVTPETAKSSHYFWAGSRNFALNDSVVNEQFRRGYDHAFTQQDRPIIEGVQQMMGEREFWSLKPVLLINDAASVHARRVMRRLAEQESTDSAAATQDSEMIAPRTGA